MEFGHSVLVVALLVQVYNLGTIWLAQTTVYPLFAQVAAEGYAAYHRFYTTHITFSVIIPGFLSFVLPAAVLLTLPGTVPLWLAVANLSMGIAGLLITVVLQIPRHNRLDHGKDDRLIAELIRFNWLRTGSITVSAALTLAMASCALAPIPG
jgi:hypothetical protein